ncbi:helix-turn-helix domain-containing protein [Microbacterium sp. NPDC058345]|uniref:helix-turn-helix domain-containing protein n=1 Tax=Microbacterium sp. NPDC058345 TaxID=3346455 RepID=UPI00365A9ED4
MAEIVPFPSTRTPRQPEPLWRELLGAELRRRRHERGDTLTETADAAGVSPQYLSEMERGLKEPSSEMIAAVAGALESSLLELAGAVADGLRPAAPQRSAGQGSVALAA